MLGSTHALQILVRHFRSLFVRFDRKILCKIYSPSETEKNKNKNKNVSEQGVKGIVRTATFGRVVVPL